MAADISLPAPKPALVICGVGELVQRCGHLAQDFDLSVADGLRDLCESLAASRPSVALIACRGRCTRGELDALRVASPETRLVVVAREGHAPCPGSDMVLRDDVPGDELLEAVR